MPGRTRWLNVGEEYWIQTPKMINNRGWHSVSQLPDGKALCVGGFDLGGNTPVRNQAEIFDSDSRTFSAAAPLPGVRALHVAFPLSGGRVLVACGSTTNFSFSSSPTDTPRTCFIYSHSTNTWQQTGDTPAANGYLPACDPIPYCVIKGGPHDGKPFVAGGMGFETPTGAVYSSGGTTGSMRFDPNAAPQQAGFAKGRWVSTASMGRARAYNALIPIGGGKVLAVGGVSNPGLIPFFVPDNWTDTVEIYDSVTDTWTDLAADPMPVIVGEKSGLFDIGAPAGKPAGYAARRMQFTGIMLGEGKALIVGGMGPTPGGDIKARPRSSCLIFDNAQADGSKWRQTDSIGTGRMWGHLNILDDGTILSDGGADEYFRSGVGAQVFDPLSETWRFAADMPSPGIGAGQRKPSIMNGNFHWFGVKLTNGLIFIAGGASGLTLNSGFHAFAQTDGSAALFIPGGPSSTAAAQPTPGTDTTPAGTANIIDTWDHGSPIP